MGNKDTKKDPLKEKKDPLKEKKEEKGEKKEDPKKMYFSIFGGKLGFSSPGTPPDRSGMSNLYGHFFWGASVGLAGG